MRVRQKLFQSAAFISHWLRAVNEHALHPPFIFDLYTRVIKADSHEPVFKSIESCRQKLLKNHSYIETTDLGAGSALSSGPGRKISHIARNSLTPASFSRLMYRFTSYMQAKNVLELGTSLGINTLYLSAAVQEGQVYTLEGCPRTASLAREIFKNQGANNIHLKEGPIDTILPGLLESALPKVDAVYIDANHTYAATLRYFHTLLPFLHENSFVVADDIYWSPGMKKAWEEICQHEKVRLSIDLYDAGILFFRPGLQKAHYIL